MLETPRRKTRRTRIVVIVAKTIAITGLLSFFVLISEPWHAWWNQGPPGILPSEDDWRVKHHIQQAFTCVGFAPDGKHFATGDEDHTVQVYETESGKLVHSWNARQADPGAIVQSGLRHVQYSPAGDRLLTVGDAGNIRVWDAKEFKLIAEIGTRCGHGNRQIVWSPDGTQIAGAERQVMIWNASDGKLVSSFGHEGQRIHGVFYSPDGQMIATTGYDAMVRLWDATTFKQIALLRGQPDRVSCGAFSPDGRLFASGGTGTTDRQCIVVWDAKTHELKHRLKSKWVVEGIRFTPMGRLETLNRFRMHVWDPDSGELIAARHSHLYPNKPRPYYWFTWATFDSKRQYLITTVERNGVDGDLRMWKKVQ